MFTAHFPICSNTELSSNKYRFLNSLLLPKTHPPSPLLRIECQQTTGLEIVLWGLNFISLVTLFQQKLMDMLAYQEKTKNSLKAASCSNPSCRLLAVGLSPGCPRDMTSEPPHGFLRGGGAQGTGQEDGFCLELTSRPRARLCCFHRNIPESV